MLECLQAAIKRYYDDLDTCDTIFAGEKAIDQAALLRCMAKTLMWPWCWRKYQTDLDDAENARRRCVDDAQEDYDLHVQICCAGGSPKNFDDPHWEPPSSKKGPCLMCTFN